jgi:oligopeptide/dipeptide ABC transporter ATP-binding protein
MPADHDRLLLDVRDLTTTVSLPGGPAPAVDSVGFHIRAGETLGLVGESGSGKSMTALSIVRLLPESAQISHGQMLLSGRNLRTLSEREMRTVRGASIGFIFQEPMAALDPVWTIGDHLVEALTLHGQATGDDAREKAVRLLETVRVPDAAARMREYPHQLSGGLRQRVCIAIALACTPSLLIADEPTTALDVTIQADILELLRDMQQRLGLAVLLITHDLSVVAQAADRIAVMYAGRIVETGPVRDVLRHPRHPYTQGLLASMPSGVDGAALRPIGGIVPRLGALPKGCAFHPRCPNRIAPCDTAVPGAYALTPEHSVRCFLHDAHAAR